MVLEMTMEMVMVTPMELKTIPMEVTMATAPITPTTLTVVTTTTGNGATRARMDLMGQHPTVKRRWSPF